MQRVTHPNGVITYTFDAYRSLPVSVHISTRHGGVSPAPWNTLNFSVLRGDEPERVAVNRARFVEALGIDGARLATCRQVHGALAAAVDAADAGRMQDDADALVTNTADLPLSLVFADCVPVVLYDPVQHALAVCHAGWRGTVKGAAAAALAKMTATYGTKPADVIAGIGPSIGPESYEVGDEVVAVARQSPYQAWRYLDFGNGARRKPYFDLWAANAGQLIESGVPARNIEVSGIDTATNTHDFFSHRAEQGRCGLFGMAAWLHQV